MPASTKYHGKRALLNGPGYHTTGAIVAEIEDTSTWPEDKNGRGNDLSRWDGPRYVLQISDCSRPISISLDLESEEDFANNLHKLDTMIDALTSMRAGVIIEQERLAERRANLPLDEDDDDAVD